MNATAIWEALDCLERTNFAKADHVMRHVADGRAAVDALLARVAEAEALAELRLGMATDEAGEVMRLRAALGWIVEFPRTLDTAVRERARAALAGGDAA